MVRAPGYESVIYEIESAAKARLVLNEQLANPRQPSNARGLRTPYRRSARGSVGGTRVGAAGNAFVGDDCYGANEATFGGEARKRRSELRLKPFRLAASATGMPASTRSRAAWRSTEDARGRPSRFP